jgi:hypothetical protein
LNNAITVRLVITPLALISNSNFGFPVAPRLLMEVDFA